METFHHLGSCLTISTKIRSSSLFLGVLVRYCRKAPTHFWFWVVSKEQIHTAWSEESGEVGGGNAIEVYVHRLRRKTEGAGVNIRTVRGIGYLLEAEGGR